MILQAILHDEQDNEDALHVEYDAEGPNALLRFSIGTTTPGYEDISEAVYIDLEVDQLVEALIRIGAVKAL